MAGWSEEIEWGGPGEDSAGLVNVPTGLLLGAEGLAGCARERLAPMYATNPAEDFLTPNAPTNLEQLRSYLVACVDGLFVGTTSRRQYIRPGTNDYDWTDESDIDRWDMTKMEIELGVEPVTAETNGPVSAAWVKWWYNALNLLTRVEYGRTSGVLDHGYQQSRRFGYSFQGTYAEAKADFDSDTWATWSDVLSGHFSPNHYVSAGDSDTYIINRNRYRSKLGFKPNSYTRNYKLEAWAVLRRAEDGYENSDYPCNEDTYANIWEDADNQSEEYDKQVLVGDFDTVTVGDPGTGKTVGWLLDPWLSGGPTVSTVCQFDIEGGFEYVAPEE